MRGQEDKVVGPAAVALCSTGYHSSPSCSLELSTPHCKLLPGVPTITTVMQVQFLHQLLTLHLMTAMAKCLIEETLSCCCVLSLCSIAGSNEQCCNNATCQLPCCRAELQAPSLGHCGQQHSGSMCALCAASFAPPSALLPCYPITFPAVRSLVQVLHKLLDAPLSVSQQAPQIIHFSIPILQQHAQLAQAHLPLVPAQQQCAGTW